MLLHSSKLNSVIVIIITRPGASTFKMGLINRGCTTITGWKDVTCCIIVL